MFKFYVDAYADMFGDELKECGLFLAPSKIKKNRSIIDFKGYKNQDDLQQAIEDVQGSKCTIIPLTKDEWVDFFKQDLDKGDDIVFFSISFHMLQDKGKALKEAFATLNKLYPSRKAILLDTCTVSRGTSELASLVNLVFQKNQDIDEALDYAESLIGKFVSVIAIDSIEGLKNSTLLAPIIEGFAGSSLNLKPILCIDTGGKFKVLDKAKGFKSAVNKLYSNVKTNGQNIADYTFSVVSFNADKEAQDLYNKFREVVNENEVRLVPLSLNNAIKLGGKCVGVTFHSKY